MSVNNIKQAKLGYFAKQILSKRFPKVKDSPILLSLTNLIKFTDKITLFKTVTTVSTYPQIL